MTNTRITAGTRLDPVKALSLAMIALGISILVWIALYHP